MQCCMPLCKNTSENISKCGIITFHRFPSKARLRAAWLKALGKQDSHLPDAAVVCSQHFLHDDICETKSGSRKLRTGAVPSTVLVCMMCLDTDSKMSLISQYNLEEAYEKLTGHPVCVSGSLKQSLCVQCAHRLRNFSRFRDKSLRARSLIMELLEKHEMITVQHIKTIKHANNQLRNNLVSTMLGPDACDMYIIQNFNENRQVESEKSVHRIKTECSDDYQSLYEDTQMINEDNEDCGKVEISLDPLKYESTPFMCTVCHEEFSQEHAYNAHVGIHMHPAAPSAVVTPLLARRSTNTGNEARTTEEAATTQHREQALETISVASDNRASNSNSRINADIKNSVKMYFIVNYPHNNIKVQSSPQTQAINSRDSISAHTAYNDAQYNVKTENEVSTTLNEPAASLLSETEPSTSGNSPRTRTLSCDICQHAFTRKYSFDMHMRRHTGEKHYSCKICGYKFAQKRSLADHMLTHTNEMPYSCKLCSYKTTQKKNLVIHIRTHTGEKRYPCKICGHRSTTKRSLNDHIRTHTGEKPYSCDICGHKCIQKCNLVIHMSTHTGEKPYSCKICGYRFAQNSRLVDHMRTHTGEKPYSCEICGLNCSSKGTLNRHIMRKHT